MKIFDTKIISHEMISENYLLIEVMAPEDIKNLGIPGQFYELKISDDPTKLRVPISIYDIKDKTISFLIKIVGNKTQKLKNKKIGDILNLQGPLGNGFIYHLPPSTYNLIFVSGGIGYAPLNYLYASLPNANITWLHGGRNRGEVEIAIKDNKAQIICTDDGSYGEKGLVTTQLTLNTQLSTPNSIIVSCGPLPMMQTLLKIAKQHNLPLIVSLEEYMSCGVGVCYGCAVALKDKTGYDKYVRVCTDGPIFDAYKLEGW